MSLSAVSLALLFVINLSCGQYIFDPATEIYQTESELVPCPESCPDESSSNSICASNGYCIKFFKSNCHLVDINCKSSQEYTEIHEDYCTVERFKNLLPKDCFNDTFFL